MKKNKKNRIVIPYLNDKAMSLRVLDTLKYLCWNHLESCIIIKWINTNLMRHNVPFFCTDHFTWIELDLCHAYVTHLLIVRV